MITAKKFLASVFFLLTVVLVATFVWKIQYKDSLVIGGKTFFIKIADTDEERALGLSGTKNISNREGLLFVFPTDDVYGFWMKDMNFPIDIVWIDKNMKIVHIEKNLSPESYPKVFTPDAESRYVLEISAGQAEQLKLKIGDIVKL